MILYNSDANDTGMVGKYVGDSVLDRDKTTFKSFEKAKKVAISNLKEKIRDLQDDMKKLEEMTEETCPYIRNPFTGYSPEGMSRRMLK